MEPLTSALKAADKASLAGMDARQRAKKVGKQSVSASPDRLAAFAQLKALLSSAPVLRYPNYKKPFFLYTDASKVGVGAALQQECDDDNGRQHPILFISRSLSPAKKHYSATELECLGVYWSFTKLSHYLDGSSVTVITDHHALQWLWSIKQSTNSRLHKWAMLLGPMEGKMTIVHRPGLAHSNADPISRFPVQRTFASFPDMLAPSGSSAIAPDLLDRVRLAYASDDDFGGFVQPPPDTRPDGDFSWDPTGLLLRRGAAGTFLLCIPQSCRLDVIRALHDELGHPSAKRTLAKASERVFWPRMSRDIHLYCRSCHNCQVVKTDTSRKPGILQPIPAVAPFHTLCIDFVEGLPPCGMLDSLATCTDKFTKAVRLLPCSKSDSAIQFARRYFTSVFSSWCVPSVIISDRDRRFTSGFWDTLMSLAGTKLAMTTAYHPRADGQSERTNRTIEATLRIMILESDSRWVDLLPAVEFAHNSCINLTTNRSPFDLLYGCSPANFGDVASRVPLRHSIVAEEMAAALSSRRKDAATALTRAQEHHKLYYDRRHSPISFLPGDLACLRFYRRGKLDPVAGVVQILEVVSPVAYRIRVPPGSQMHDVVSIEHLRRYVSRDRTIPALPAPEVPPTVSKILGQRMWKGHLEVLCVRDAAEASDAIWEDVTAVAESPHLLREFRARWDAWVAPAAPRDPPTPLTLGDAACADPTPLEPFAPATSGPRRSGRARRPSRRALES